MTEEMGKIKRIKLGMGGYQDAMFGVTVDLSIGESGGVGDFKGAWCPARHEGNSHCKWTEEDRDAELAKTMRFLAGLMKDANVTALDELVGKPVMITMDGQCMKSWRILTEVI